MPEDPLALRYDKRVVVYVQANIHAGEVEGKESALMLARDIVLDPKLPYLDKIVLLIAPDLQRRRQRQDGPARTAGARSARRRARASATTARTSISTATP